MRTLSDLPTEMVVIKRALCRGERGALFMHLYFDTGECWCSSSHDPDHGEVVPCPPIGTRFPNTLADLHRSIEDVLGRPIREDEDAELKKRSLDVWIRLGTFAESVESVYKRVPFEGSEVQ